MRIQTVMATRKRKRCEPQQGPYLPTPEALKFLTDPATWDFKEETAYLQERAASVSKQQQQPPRGARPKVWRTEPLSEEDEKRLLSAAQGGPDWLTAREASTGDSAAFAAICDLAKPHSNSSVQHAIDSGMVASGDPTEESMHAMNRGNYGEPLVEKIGSAVMGYTVEATPGYVTDEKRPHKHTSPDRDISYPPGVHHNRYCTRMCRRCLAEYKYHLVFASQCIHTDAKRAVCRRRATGGGLHKCSPGYALQTQGQVAIYAVRYLLKSLRFSDLSLEEDGLWNDFHSLWRANSKHGPVALTPDQIEALPAYCAIDGAPCAPLRSPAMLIGELFVTRVMFNRELIEWAYDRFDKHVEAVRWTQEELASGMQPEVLPVCNEIPFIPAAGGGDEEVKIKMINLKHAQFVQSGDGVITCHITHFWDSKPFEVSMRDLAEW